MKTQTKYKVQIRFYIFRGKSKPTKQPTIHHNLYQVCRSRFVFVSYSLSCNSYEYVPFESLLINVFLGNTWSTHGLLKTKNFLDFLSNKKVFVFFCRFNFFHVSLLSILFLKHRNEKNKTKQNINLDTDAYDYIYL